MDTIIAEQAYAKGERIPLFLLDEILHGTNTRERQIAVRYIVTYLLERGATGVISTHDLSLAVAPELAAVSTPIYLTEQFTRGPEGPVMHFDYRVRPGLAPTTNALHLMELAGLPIDVTKLQGKDASAPVATDDVLRASTQGRHQRDVPETPRKPAHKPQKKTPPPHTAR